MERGKAEAGFLILGKEGGASRRICSGRILVLEGVWGISPSLNTRGRDKGGGLEGGEVEAKLFGERNQSVLVDLARSNATEAGDGGGGIGGNGLEEDGKSSWDDKIEACGGEA